MAKETSKRATVGDPNYAPADYYDVVYLKQVEKDGPWHADSKQFPTKEEADAHAAILSEGRHGAVKVMPRNWA